jgi:tryptophan synthase alpha chain
MSRLSDAFARARAEGRTAFVAYAMGGDPSIEATEALLLALDGAGADVIELGIPFSDPIADGPTLQAAATRALTAGASLSKLLAMLQRLRGKLRAAVVTMGYVNPFLAYGLERFAAEAAAAGVSGAIVPDLPFEEAEPVRAALAAHGIELVPLVAPTTSPERMHAIAAQARGFVYYVSVTGVTGARAQLPADMAERLQLLRRASPAPVAVGFGISRPEQAAALRGAADGVVVGSALVQAHHERGTAAARELAASIAAALRHPVP